MNQFCNAFVLLALAATPNIRRRSIVQTKMDSNLCRAYWIRIRLLYGSVWVLWLLRGFLDGRRRRLRWRAQVHCGRFPKVCSRLQKPRNVVEETSSPNHGSGLRYVCNSGTFPPQALRLEKGTDFYPFFRRLDSVSWRIDRNMSSPLASRFSSERLLPKRLTSRRVRRGNGMWG